MSNSEFKPVNKTLTLGADVYEHTPYYIATNYDISPSNADNTAALQNLIDKISVNGGGTIYFPVGTYCFGIGGTLLHNENTIPYSVLMKSNVSIIGESMDKTILKQNAATKENSTTPQPYSLFVYFGNANTPITGCTYSNFTVDASETEKATEENAFYSKAFYYQYIEDCIFRDLILKGTLGTALGIDYLNRVQIENVNCFYCGRNFWDNDAATGSSGIGIGTGGWENENFYIHNCTCVGSGQYGIFIENQTRFGWGGSEYYSKGCVISDCITRNGNHRGIGIRGGQYVTVIGCESYENQSDGIYLDGYCKNVKIHACNFADNGGNGIHLADSDPEHDLKSIFEKMIFSGNMIDSNHAIGINVTVPVTDLVIMNNYAKGNLKPLHVSANAYVDCILKDNVFFGTIEDYGTYAGNLLHNELLKDHECISIPYGEFTQGLKIMPNGKEAPEASSMSTGFIDITSFAGNTFTLGVNSEVNLIRVAQYNSQEDSLSENFGKIKPCSNDTFTSSHSITKQSDAKYIRVFVEYAGKPMTEDFFASVYK